MSMTKSGKDCGKTQQNHPRAVVISHVPECFADLGQGTQVMMGLHQLLVTGSFTLLYGMNVEFFYSISNS